MPSSSFSDPSMPPGAGGGHAPFSVPSSGGPVHVTGDSSDRGSTMMYNPMYGGGGGGMLYNGDGGTSQQQQQPLHQQYPGGGPPHHHHQAPPGMYNYLYPPAPYGAYAPGPGRPPWHMQYGGEGGAIGGAYNHHRPGAMMAGGGNSTLTSTSPDSINQDLHEKASDSQSQNSKGGCPEEELEEVKPIQTDFHCFALQWKDKLYSEAEAEVDASLQGYDEDFKAKHRLCLVNSNLNCRLMKKWEDFTMEEREDFFQKEEDDRRRFMTEDEVISRHCFTLTARVRSPTKKNPDEELGEKRPQPESSPTSADEETPPKKTRTTTDATTS